MSQPVRLLVGAPQSELARLVRAARHERPAPKLPGRILAGLAGSAAASLSAAAGATATAGAAASLTSTSLLLVVGKWVGVGVLGGGLLAAGAGVAFAPRTTPTPAPAQLAAPTTKPSSFDAKGAAAPQPALVENAVPAAPSTPSPSAATAEKRPAAPPLVDVGAAASAASAASPTQASRLAHEAALVEAARGALAAGNPNLALQKLAEYRSEPATGTLEREARVLRIEALVRRGELQQARTLAEAYLREFPQDAHQTRLRGLLQAAPRGSIAERGDTRGSGE